MRVNSKEHREYIAGLLRWVREQEKKKGYDSYMKFLKQEKQRKDFIKAQAKCLKKWVEVKI